MSYTTLLKMKFVTLTFKKLILKKEREKKKY